MIPINPAAQVVTAVAAGHVQDRHELSATATEGPGLDLTTAKWLDAVTGNGARQIPKGARGSGTLPPGSIVAI